MSTANTVVKFPGKSSFTSSVNEVKTKEEVDESVQNMKIYHVQEVCSELIDMLVTRMAAAGFDITDEDSDTEPKVLALLFESLVSTMYEMKGIAHPLQLLAHELYDENNGVLRLKESVTLTDFNMSESV